MNDAPLIATLRTWEERCALHTPGASYSYRELCEAIDQKRIVLAQAGVAPGDTVFLQGNYGLEGIALFLALYQNANIVAMNTVDHAGDIQGKLVTSRASFFADLRTGTLRLMRVSEEAGMESPLVDGLRSRGLAGLILFSSGTTGKPKAMLHDLNKLAGGYAGKRARPLTMLLFLLFDHIGGINTLLNILSIGGAAVIPDQATPEQVAALIERFHVSVLPTSPTFLNLLLLSGALVRHDISSLRMITYGTEPMPDGLLARLHERLPRVKLLQTFGTSETGIVSTTSLSSESLFMKFNDPSMEHKVIDGELWLRSQRRMLGYLNHESDALTDDGWFRTGDMVAESGDGYMRILGRSKEVINVGGEKVFPAEVESVLLRHPLVRDCKAYGEPNGLTGQFVAADVVLGEAGDETQPGMLRQIRAYARQHMDTYKVPVRLKAVEHIAYSARFKKVLR